MHQSVRQYNKRILLAVDETENSRKAVAYVAQLLGGLEGFHVVFLHVIDPPEEDYFTGRLEQEEWMRSRRLEIGRCLERYRSDLVRAGFRPGAISLLTTMRSCPSLAECILNERKRLGCSTVVVGRHGLTRGEEILFGSISSKIVSCACDCTVWIVE